MANSPKTPHEADTHAYRRSNDPQSQPPTHHTPTPAIKTPEKTQPQTSTAKGPGMC